MFRPWIFSYESAGLRQHLLLVPWTLGSTALATNYTTSWTERCWSLPPAHFLCPQSCKTCKHAHASNKPHPDSSPLDIHQPPPEEIKLNARGSFYSPVASVDQGAHLPITPWLCSRAVTNMLHCSVRRYQGISFEMVSLWLLNVPDRQSHVTYSIQSRASCFAIQRFCTRCPCMCTTRTNKSESFGSASHLGSLLKIWVLTIVFHFALLFYVLKLYWQWFLYGPCLKLIRSRVWVFDIICFLWVLCLLYLCQLHIVGARGRLLGESCWTLVCSVSHASPRLWILSIFTTVGGKFQHDSRKFWWWMVQVPFLQPGDIIARWKLLSGHFWPSDHDYLGKNLREQGELNSLTMWVMSETATCIMLNVLH